MPLQILRCELAPLLLHFARRAGVGVELPPPRALRSHCTFDTVQLVDAVFGEYCVQCVCVEVELWEELAAPAAGEVAALVLVGSFADGALGVAEFSAPSPAMQLGFVECTCRLAFAAEHAERGTLETLWAWPAGHLCD